MSNPNYLQQNVFAKYDEWVNLFEGGNVIWFFPILQKMVDEYLSQQKLETTSPLSFADLGCGTASFADAILKYYVRSTYFGADGSQGMYERASARLQGAEQRATVVNADFRSPEFIAAHEGEFDVVFAVGAADGVNHYWEHVLPAVKMAKMGGLIVLSDFLAGNQQDNFSNAANERTFIASKEAQNGYTELLKKYSLGVRDYIRAVMNRYTLATAKLVFSESFKQHDKTVTKPTPDEAIMFNNKLVERNEAPGFVIAKNLPYNPIIMVLRKTETLVGLLQEYEVGGEN